MISGKLDLKIGVLPVMGSLPFPAIFFGLRSFGLLQFPTELPRVILPYLVGPRGLDTN